MGTIVDGYNVIFAEEELAEYMRAGLLEEARNGLISLLTCFQALSGDPVTVVFDGSVGFGMPAEGRDGVRILYSRSPEKADHVIRNLIEKDPNPKKLMVVSTDREIRSAAKARRAHPVIAESFLNELARVLTKAEDDAPPPEPGEKYGQPISPAELRHWMEVFGQDDEDPQASP